MAMTPEQLQKERNKLWKPIEISDYSVCYHCKTKGLKDDDFFCPNCRFPQHGTQDEMKKFLTDINRKHQLLIDKSKAIRKARNILFALAAINFGFGVLFNFLSEIKIPEVFIASTIIALIYFGLAIWSMKNPFAAIISGFIVYIVFIAINAVADPNTLYQGLIWKAIIISAFVYGYIAAKDSGRLEQEIAAISEAKDLS